jgi:hypothetical protein
MGDYASLYFWVCLYFCLFGAYTYICIQEKYILALR